MSGEEGPGKRTDGPSPESRGSDLESRPVEFDPVRMFQLLDKHGVSYVVIGGVAGRLYGSPLLTDDLDICYERSKENLEALARALREMRATLRGVDPRLPFQLDARALAFGDSFTFTTDVGNLDCLATPEGTGGYRDLIKKAVEFEVAGFRIKTVSLEDLIRMKKATGRAKDRADLEVLGATQFERECMKEP